MIILAVNSDLFETFITSIIPLKKLRSLIIAIKNSEISNKLLQYCYVRLIIDIIFTKYK